MRNFRFYRIIKPFKTILHNTRLFYSTNKNIKYIEPKLSKCFFDDKSKTYFSKNFGKWTCLNCKNVWYSAYTWISLDFCKKNTEGYINKKTKNNKIIFSGDKLKDEEFLLQKCKKCPENDSNVKILNYSKLEVSDDNLETLPHRSDLCIKCLKGHKCRRDYNT